MGLSRRMLILLDVLVGVLVVAQLLESVLDPDPGPVPRVVPVAALTGIAVCWVLWRVSARRAWLMGFMVLVVPATLTGGGGVSLVLLLLALSLVGVSFGMRWAIGWLLLVAAAGIPIMVRFGKGLGGVVVETIGILVLGSLGLVLGQLLRELNAERLANQRLLDELRRTHHVETELMLADERARSARELHDGLGHRLTLIGLSLEYAGRMRERDADKAYAEVEHARAQASEALAYMRRWVRALNPPRESALTGIAAFEAIADSFRGTGLTVTVHQSGTERTLGKQASLFAHRLVQEGLTNVLRHSAADEVDLRIDWGAHDVTITVRDNGLERGGEIADDTAAGFGLRSLAERAEQLGGSFAARSDDRGMVLTGRVRDEADEPAKEAA